MDYTIPIVNTTGLDSILTEVTTQVPTFTPFFLLFVWGIIFFTGYRKGRETGNGDAPLWAVTAGIITTIIALLLSMTANLIDPLTLVTTIVITITCGAWFFSSRDRV